MKSKGSKLDYMLIRGTAAISIRKILKQNRGLLQKITALGSETIEMMCTCGTGDNGEGYYQAFLILDLKNLNNRDKNVIYLTIKYRPDINIDHKLEEYEIYEKLTCDFAEAIVILKYLQAHESVTEMTKELVRLSKRKYASCVENIDIPHFISFQ